MKYAFQFLVQKLQNLEKELTPKYEWSKQVGMLVNSSDKWKQSRETKVDERGYN